QGGEGDAVQPAVLAGGDAPEVQRRPGAGRDQAQPLAEGFHRGIESAHGLAEARGRLEIVQRERPDGDDAAQGSDWGTSSGMSFASICPLRPVSPMPSLIMVRQKGQLGAIVPLPPSVLAASWTRFWLMRWPMVSSSHMRPPPAPQQNVSVRLR